MKLKNKKPKHMKENKSKKSIKKFLILYFIFAVTIVCQYSQSKFATSIYKDTSVYVAKPTVNLIGSDINKVEFVKETEHKCVAEYNFTITNYIDDDINEVNMRYFIDINIGNEFTYLLYKDEVKDTNLISNIESYSEIIGHDSKENHNYILKIVYEPTQTVNAYETNFSIDVSYVQENSV